MEIRPAETPRSVRTVAEARHQRPILMILLDPQTFSFVLLNASMSLYEGIDQCSLAGPSVQSVLHQLVESVLIDGIKNLGMRIEVQQHRLKSRGDSGQSATRGRKARSQRGITEQAICRGCARRVV